MNLLDRAIAVVSPERALQRERARMGLEMVQTFKNSGYSHSGGSTNTRSTVGWHYDSKTPQEDIDYNLDVVRQRSRDLYMSAPIATSAIKNNRANVIGSGLRLKSRIDYELLNLSEKSARVWERKTEAEFSLWASSRFCDATRLNNFYELQQLALMSWLMNGDGISVIKYDAEPKSFMPYQLRLHMIEADRISTPNSTPRGSSTVGVAQNGNRIFSGVEIDSSGAVQAYHICNMYPNSNASGITGSLTRIWQRVEAFGRETGNPNIIHIMEQERAEQYRGIPLLAPVIETLKQMTRYTKAEINAAVISSFFTAFIKTDGPTSATPPMGEAIPEEDRVSSRPEDYELGAGTINVLGPGESIEFADPKRPASGFDMFITAITKQIGAALEVPYEMLLKSFSSSYSASRAAFLEAWKIFKMRRSWFANDFCQPVYILFLSEAVAKGRIDAPGFFTDPRIKAAWCGSEWNGPAPGQIDPYKEVQAAAVRVKEGFSTRTRETMELTGGDFANNAVQLKREQELLNQIGEGME